MPFEAYAAEVFREENPAFVIQDGYYSVFGMPTATYEGLIAHYARTEAFLSGEVEWTAPAAWVFDRFTFGSAEQPLIVDASSVKALKNDLLMYENDLRLEQNVTDHVMARYGTPDAAYVALSFWSGSYCLVAERELPYVICDAAFFARMNSATDFKVILVFGNVLYTMDAALLSDTDGRNTEGSYTLSIDYLNHPAAASDFSDLHYGDTYEADTAQPFPMLEGQIPYTVIEP